MGCYERDWGKVTNEKNGGQGNKRALKEKEIEVSVEIVLKKIEGYVIKNYLYLINVEVSRSINFNFNRQSTDSLPTSYQQSADVLPTVGGGELFFTITDIGTIITRITSIWKTHKDSHCVAVTVCKSSHGQESYLRVLNCIFISKEYSILEKQKKNLLFLKRTLCTVEIKLLEKTQGY